MAIYPVLSIVFLAVVPAFTRAQFCHQLNSFSYENECLRIVNWEQESEIAEMGCELNGGRLAAITSQEKLEFLTSKLSTSKTTLFWVSFEALHQSPQWPNFPWVSESLKTVITGNRNNSVCVYFNTESGIIEKAHHCLELHRGICERSAFLFNATENCHLRVSEHSFIGEETGRCVYRLPISTKKADVNSKCAETEGEFLNLDSIMRDGLNAFYEHKVMVNDNKQYWTSLTWNGSHVLWESGEILEQHFKFTEGNGSCITVKFSFTNILEAQLFQKECMDQAYVICGSISTSTVAPTSRPAQQQMLYCPPGHNWKSSSLIGQCYWETSYETNKMSWDDAQSYCQGFGGDLASFHSVEEEKIGLSFQYGSFSHPYWIGLRLDPETMTYKWSDGSPLDYENWAPNHPNHRDMQLRCVSMDARSKHWVSSLCGIISWFVCKAPKKSETREPVIPTRPPLISCGDTLNSSAYYFNGYCYSVVKAQSSWHRAKQHCENEGSSLVSIHSGDEIGFLLRMLYDDKDIRGSRVWIGLNTLSGGVLRWTDWSPVDFTYWNDNEPNNHLNQEKCCNMYWGNGLWNDENCNVEMGFICKQVRDAAVTHEIQTTRDPLLGNCKKGWYAYHDRCFLPKGTLEKERLNWTAASNYCTSLGSYLTSIRNSREQAYLAYLMQSLKEDTWIGLHDTTNFGRYYWLDNSDMQFSNWAQGQPPQFEQQENCVKMNYREIDSGIWAAEGCNLTLPFICATERDPDITQPVYNRGSECIHPKGWLKLGLMCFKIFEGNHLKWEEAETACRREGAHLISITGTHVQAVATFLGLEVNQTFWIGLLYDDKSQKLLWLNNWPVNISKWGNSEPGIFDDRLCYASTSDGYWKRFPCDKELPYICQITAGPPPPVKKYTGDCIKSSNKWISTDGNYCLHVENNRTDWNVANFRCFIYGSYMISIHSFQELEAVKKIIDINVPSIFLGLTQNGNDGYIWTDGSPVDFVNWDYGEPENTEAKCVEMMMDTLKWRAVSCEVKKQFVCSSKKIQEVEITPSHEKLVSDSSTILSSAALAGIAVPVIILVLAIIIVGIYLFQRRPLGKSRFRIPFSGQSMSFENALYNANTTSMEFRDSRHEIDSDT